MQDALLALPQVVSAAADFQSGRVVLELREAVPPKQLTAAVRAAGYTITKQE